MHPEVVKWGILSIFCEDFFEILDTHWLREVQIKARFERFRFVILLSVAGERDEER